MYLLIFSVWLILNGRVTTEICIFGIIISTALFWFLCRFMNYSLKKEILIFRLLPLLIQYFWVLVKEIVKANVCVLKLILSPELCPEPALVYFDTELKTGIAKVMLADSITLTPGTITVSLEGNRYCVHCLDKELAEGMENSIFVELLQKMETFIGTEFIESQKIQKAQGNQTKQEGQGNQTKQEAQENQTKQKALGNQIGQERIEIQPEEGIGIQTMQEGKKSQTDQKNVEIILEKESMEIRRRKKRRGKDGAN